MSRRPKRSSPTFPIIAVEQPYFCNAARKLQGAPPGWAFSVGYPAASAATGAKSMSISPRATMVGTRTPLSILHSSAMQMIALHKNGFDVFSALCYFFAMILPALQAIVEQQLFYGKVVTPCCASINSCAFCMFSPYIPVPFAGSFVCSLPG